MKSGYLFWLLFSLVTAQEKLCGKSFLPLLGQHVVDGSDSAEGIFPWQLSLEEKEEGTEEWQHACGAVLIDAHWALTAAHCVDGNITDFRVIAGELDMSVISGNEQTIYIADIIIHPGYNPEEIQLPNDLAILSLAEPADLENDSINAICLPPSPDSTYYEHPSCYITGWGVTDPEDSELSDVLQRSAISVIRVGECDPRWPDFELLFSQQTCTFDHGLPGNRRKTLCHGDLGGPLQCMVDAQWELAAISSFIDEDCDTAFPNVWQSMPVHLDWVVAETGVQPRPPM